MKKKGMISPIEAGFLLSSSFIGLGIFMWPRDSVMVAGRSAILSFVLSVFLAFAGLWMLVQLSEIFPGLTFVNYSKKIVGKPLSLFFSFYIILYNIFFAAIAAHMFGDLISTVFLVATPPWASVGILFLAAAYATYGGLETIARASQIILPLGYLFILFGILLAVKHMEQFWALLPSHISLSHVWHGTYISAYVIIGFQLIIMLYPYIHTKDRRKTKKALFIAASLNMLLLLSIYIMDMTVLGPGATKVFYWPTVTSFRILEFSSFFVNRVGLLVVLSWTLLMFLFLATRIWCVSHDITAMLGRNHTHEYRNLVIPVTGLMFLTSLLPSNPIAATYIVDQYINPGGLIIILLLPLILLLIAKIRGLKPPEEPGSNPMV